VNGVRPGVGIGVVLLAVVPLACSGDDDAETGPGPAAATSDSIVATTAPISVTPSSAELPASTDAATTMPTTVASTTTSTTEASTTTTTTTVPDGVVPGIATIALLTNGSGLGARPLLRWEPVDGAAAYVLSVNAPGGGPLWAWEGSSTEVPYGGGPTDDPDTTGARLLQPATWFVAAKSADGGLLAVSARADIAP
jgi:hypothetical protein